MEQTPEELNNAPVSPAGKHAFTHLYLPVVLLELVMTGIMLAVYALLGRWSGKVLAGALLGLLVTLVYFGALIVSLLRVEQAETPERGQLLARGSSTLRLLVLFVVLVLLLRTGIFAPLATLLPLCFMRIALFAAPLLEPIIDKKRKKENP